jgi:ankyrin repeat protein
MDAVSGNVNDVFAAEGASALQLSALAGHADIVTMLMDIGANLEIGEINSLMRGFADNVAAEHSKMISRIDAV